MNQQLTPYEIEYGENQQNNSLQNKQLPKKNNKILNLKKILNSKKRALRSKRYKIKDLKGIEKKNLSFFTKRGIKNYYAFEQYGNTSAKIHLKWYQYFCCYFYMIEEEKFQTVYEALTDSQYIWYFDGNPNQKKNRKKYKMNQIQS